MTEARVAPINSALISVSDKTGVVPFAQALAAQGVKILSTGGTCRLLLSEGIPVTEVSDHTGFPEMMDGRVKTLHPKIHGGILGRRGTDDAVMSENAIDGIDLVVVNLYPFESTVANPDCSLEDAIENFAGCAVVISHDRFFLDRLATHILAFEGNSHVEWFEGNFEAYEEDKRRRLGDAADRPTRLAYKKLTR